MIGMIPGAQSLREQQVASTDPRCQVTAYITDGVHLGEVIKRTAGEAVVENCRKPEVVWRISYLNVVQKWELVRAAPSGEVPDCLEAA